MKLRLTILILGTVVLSAKMLSISAGTPEIAVAFQPTPIKLTIPNGWPNPTIDFFAGNPLTEQGFQLGRKLFYDGRLSKDGNFACASCHQQYAAFSTSDHDLSHGFNDAFTTRNAPALFNLAWMKTFHWDGGINHIEVQALSPLTAKNEMAESIDSIIIKLKKDPVYKRMFKEAFGNSDVNSQKMLKALAQFVGSLVSYNAKYDKVKRGESAFTTSEQRGYDFYKLKCAACHAEPLFTDNSYRNNGLEVSQYLKDQGRMHATGDNNDSLKFKVPSLRNLNYTFPYMHDGRFYTLGQVIEHYRTKLITTQPTLDPLLKNRIAINAAEKNDLLNFLRTLNDTVFVNTNRYAQPK